MLTDNKQNGLTYAEKYNISSEDYSDIPVTTLPLSARVINLCMRNKLRTVDALLNTSGETIANIKGFGKNCIVELENYFSTLGDKPLFVYSNGQEENQLLVSLLKNHCDDITAGDFSFVDYDNLSENGKHIIDKYKEAAEILGFELVSECLKNPNYIACICSAFSDFQNKYKRYNEIWNLVYSIPQYRLELKAVSYINAYTSSDEKRNALYDMCKSKDCTLREMINGIDYSDDSKLLVAKRFLKWCSFDLVAEINCLKIYILKTVMVLL